DRRGDRRMLVQDLPDQHGAEQMGNDGHQPAPQRVVDDLFRRETEIGEAVRGSVEQDAGNILDALGAGPLLIELALVKLLGRKPVLNAVKLTDVEETNCVRRITLAIAIDIGLNEVRRDSDRMLNADLSARRLRNDAGGQRVSIFDNTRQRLPPERRIER